MANIVVKILPIASTNAKDVLIESGALVSDALKAGWFDLNTTSAVRVLVWAETQPVNAPLTQDGTRIIIKQEDKKVSGNAPTTRDQDPYASMTAQQMREELARRDRESGSNIVVAKVPRIEYAGRGTNSTDYVLNLDTYPWWTVPSVLQFIKEFIDESELANIISVTDESGTLVNLLAPMDPAVLYTVRIG